MVQIPPNAPPTRLIISSPIPLFLSFNIAFSGRCFESIMRYVSEEFGGAYWGFWGITW